MFTRAFLSMGYSSLLDLYRPNGSGIISINRDLETFIQIGVGGGEKVFGGLEVAVFSLYHDWANRQHSPLGIPNGLTLPMATDMHARR